MLVIVFDQVAYVFDTVFVTPVSYLPGKIPFHASGNFIHVTETHLGRQILIKFPFP